MFGAERQGAGVSEEAPVAGVKLGNKLLDVAGVGEDALPGVGHVGEEAVGGVVAPVLEAEHQVRVLADKVEEHVCRRRVVRPVQKGRIGAFPGRHVTEPLLNKGGGAPAVCTCKNRDLIRPRLSS